MLGRCIYTLTHDFVDLLYPNLCVSCQYAERMRGHIFCMVCLADLPYTHHHTHGDNQLEQQFWGRVPVESAAAAFYFVPGGRTQQLLHALKYQRKKEVGRYIGRWFGERLRHSGRFNRLDAIVPVPLHSVKHRKRGFNQSALFGDGLGQGLNLPHLPNLLTRVRATPSQTNMSRSERLKNISGAFQVTLKEEITHSHLLLVDDVVTTGATLEACACALLCCPNIRVSVAVIASGRI